MRLVLVGPTHPYKGGIAQHTTALAHQLAAAGHDVDVWSWRRQYPQRLYPGEQRVSGSVPEQPVYPRTTEPLSWNDPVGWLRAGRRAREHDGVVLTWTTPVQGPAYLGLERGLRRRSKVVAMCHNVLPHEAKPWDRPLATRVLGGSDGILVHSPAQRAVAATVAPDVPVEVATLPPPPIGAAADGPPARPGSPTRTLLMFGLVRPYKGLDLLLEALARPEVPRDARLIVAGEFWQPAETVQAEVDRLGLRGRVDLRPGYVATEDMPALFAEADAVVLPYRSGTASIVTDIAHGFGLPAIVTDVGTLAASTADGVDGLVVPASDVPALAAAIERVCDGPTLARLQAGVRPSDAAALWADYVRALEHLLS